MRAGTRMALIGVDGQGTWGKQKKKPGAQKHDLNKKRREL